MTGVVEAAREVKDKGTFGYLDRSMRHPDLERVHAGLISARRDFQPRDTSRAKRSRLAFIRSGRGPAARPTSRCR